MICRQVIVNPDWVDARTMEEVARKFQGWQYLGQVPHPVLTERWHLVQRWEPESMVLDMFYADVLDALPPSLVRLYASHHTPAALACYDDKELGLHGWAAAFRRSEQIREQRMVCTYMPWRMACMGWYWVSMHPYASAHDTEEMKAYFRRRGCFAEYEGDRHNNIYRIMPYYAKLGYVSGPVMGIASWMALQEKEISKHVHGVRLHDLHKPEEHPLTTRQRWAVYASQQMKAAAIENGFTYTIDYREGVVEFKASSRGGEQSYFRCWWRRGRAEATHKDSTPSSRVLLERMQELNSIIEQQGVEAALENITV